MLKDLQSSIELMFQDNQILSRVSDVVKEVGDTVSVPRKHILLHEGEPVSYMYFLEQGAAKSYYLQEGKEVVTGFSFEHEPIPVRFGDIQQKISGDTLVILEDAVIKRIPYPLILEKMKTNHEVSLLSLAVMNHFLMQMQQRVDNFQAKSAYERYEQLLKTRPQLLNRVKLSDVASYLGISQVSLSRIRAKLSA